MKCPYCGHDNISGSDECEYCSGNLSSLDGLVPTSRMEKVLMEDPIAKLKPREATRVEAGTTVLEAVRKMNREKVGCALATRGSQVAGIVTERDVVFKVLARNKNPAEVRVEAVMTPNPVTLEADDTLAFALNRMSVGGYRHIPILHEGRPTGIISVRDILKYLAKLFPETAR